MNVNLRMGFHINADHRLEAGVSSNKNDAQIDNSPTPLRDFRRISKVQATNGQWLAQWTERYSTRVQVSTATDRGEDAVTPLGTTLLSTDQTRISSLLWGNDYRLAANTFNATVENKKDQFLLEGSTAVPAGTGSVNREKSQNSIGLGYGWSGGAHTVQLNTRRDRDSEFGSKSTGMAAYAFALTPLWKISASGGTSFRVSTLYQRFTIYSPITPLLPESGRSVELGLKYAQGSSNFGVVAYSNRVTNLLAFASGNGTCIKGMAPVALSSRACYANTALARYTGLTFTASQTVGSFNMYGSLDLQNPKDETLDKQLARRAKRHATFGADTRVSAWTLAGDVLVSALRYDNTTATPAVLPGYALIHLSASTALTKDWKALVRVDNLTDKTSRPSILTPLPGARCMLA